MNCLSSLMSIFKGLLLPLVLPYFLYKLYIKLINQKLISSNYLQNKVILITGASSGLGEGLDSSLINLIKYLII
jgi:hypothetical protein